jgi:hypothetical protein
VASRADAVADSSGGATAVDGAGPSLRRAIREALGDLYYHSWRLVPGNVLWSFTALAVLLAVIVSPVGVAALPVLAVPTAGLFRMTTRIARGGTVSFWDAAAAWRTELGWTLALGAGLAICALVLGTNVVTGLVSATPLGWAMATLALWGLVAAWLFAWTVWPIVTDPWRAAWPVRERVRLAAVLLLAHPIRIAALGVVLAAFLAVSTVAFVALLLVSVAIASLVAARYVLPAADRLDRQIGLARGRGLAEAVSEPE